MLLILAQIHPVDNRQLYFNNHLVDYLVKSQKTLKKKINEIYGSRLAPRRPKPGTGKGQAIYGGHAENSEIQKTLIEDNLQITGETSETKREKLKKNT